MTTPEADPAAPAPAEPQPARTGPAKYLLPRSWPARVVLAWCSGVLAMLLVHLVDDTERSFLPVAYWTLIAILVAFVVSDALRAWRRRTALGS